MLVWTGQGTKASGSCRPPWLDKAGLLLPRGILLPFWNLTQWQFFAEQVACYQNPAFRLPNSVSLETEQASFALPLLHFLREITSLKVRMRHMPTAVVGHHATLTSCREREEYDTA